jgi:3-deoxy-manno-octulosonate cytidylyltransferase (CMP-KDO synthetase)
MKIVCIIPARYGSTRFPGKPLALIDGKPMIQHVAEQAHRAASPDKVVVATDDERISRVVKDCGYEAVITDTHHRSGTERCAQALDMLDEDFDLVINIQGDEPFIDPQQIDDLARMFENDKVEIATLMLKTPAEKGLHNPNMVKVVTGTDGKALYFSRAPIPFPRDAADEANSFFMKHIGIYAYRSHILKQIVKLPPGILEETEKLEQLRWLENGCSIYVNETFVENISVDTPEDLSKIINR